MIWIEKDGFKTDFQTLSQQHLSNIYWFYQIFASYIQQDPEYRQEVIEQAAEQLKSRFNGLLSPWKPEYPFEVHALDAMTLLDGPFILNFNGERIGHI
jgi:hypothetical protein